MLPKSQNTGHDQCGTNSTQEYGNSGKNDNSSEKTCITRTFYCVFTSTRGEHPDQSLEGSMSQRDFFF